MNKLGHILLADDEAVFLESTAELLRREGYECDCVSNAAEAAKKLKDKDYDLLIADIKMPGNAELELIADLPEIAEGLPVVLVTGYPSLSSAIKSISLTVSGYLVKPIDFDELLEQVRIGVEHSRVYRSIQSIKRRLQCWHEGLGDVEKLLKDNSANALPVSVDTFLELTYQNIVDSLADIKGLTSLLGAHNKDKQLCHLFNCPRLELLTQTLVETIDTLAKTKSAFKSKELGEIRRKLEKLVYNKDEEISE